MTGLHETQHAGLSNFNWFNSVVPKHLTSERAAEDMFSVGAVTHPYMIWLRKCGKECGVIIMIMELSHVHACTVGTCTHV